MAETGLKPVKPADDDFVSAGSPAGGDEQEQQTRTGAVATSVLPGPAPINILIVDNEPRNLSVLEAILDNPDYRLVQAGSAEQRRRSAADEHGAHLRPRITEPSARLPELESQRGQPAVGVGPAEFGRGVGVEVAVPAPRGTERHVDVDAERSAGRRAQLRQHRRLGPNGHPTSVPEPVLLTTSANPGRLGHMPPVVAEWPS